MLNQVGLLPSMIKSGHSAISIANVFQTDIPELNAALFIEGLQQEAQKALEEVGQPLHPDDPGRFARILLSASMLQTIPPTLLTELFFRPLIGQADLVELLVEMLLFR